MEETHNKHNAVFQRTSDITLEYIGVSIAGYQGKNLSY